MMLAPKDVKKRILFILEKEVQREGVNDLVDFLNQSDFFDAPASTRYHGAVEGGLALHSFHVYNILASKVYAYGLDVSPESTALCGLLHDLCKTEFYIMGKRWTKESGKWEEVDRWVVQDKFPLGHGEKSVFLLQRYIELTQQEALAIRWHMLAFDAGIHFNYPSGFPFRKACEDPFIICLATADLEASYILDSRGEEND